MGQENGCQRSDGVDHRRAHHARKWLGVGAMTLGVGAAVVGGAGVAAADTGTSDGSSSSAGAGDSASSSSAPANGTTSTGAPKKNRGAVNVTKSATSTKPRPKPASTKPSTSSTDSPSSTTSGVSESAAGPESAVSESESAEVAPATTTSSAATKGHKKGSKAASTKPVTTLKTNSAADTGAGVNSASAAVAQTRSTAAGTPTASASATTAAVAAVTANPTVSTAATARSPIALPTPNKLLKGLQDFGRNVYLTVTNQIYGVRRNLETLRDDLGNVLGITRNVITKALPYGNPALNTQYFVRAQDYFSSALATVAMAYGQLTGTTPDLQDFIDRAQTVDSLFYTNHKIYLGPGSTQFVIPSDSYEVLQDKGVRIISRSYGIYQGDKAFNDLTNGLQDASKAMIVTITGPVTGYQGTGLKTATVIGVDNVNGTVTLNDPTRSDGQGLTMSVDDFMDAWGKQRYQLVTTQLASAPLTPPPAPSTTRLAWSLPAPDRIGQALQHAATALAQAVVHQIDGAQDSLSTLGFDVARTFGVADSHAIAAPSPGDLEYGNYSANLPYWVYQGNYGTCALMATAAVIGQFTNPDPADMAALGQRIIDMAESTASGVKQGVMYVDGKGGTALEDVVGLLNMNGLNADYTTYLKGEDELAKANLIAALNQQQGVIVGVNNAVVYNAYTRQYFGQDQTWYPEDANPQLNHAVVVLSVNLTKGVVYLNDSAPPHGQGLAVPIDEFMKAWKTGGFATVTAERPLV